MRKRIGLQVVIPPQPFHLRTGVPVDDIAFFVLKIPRHYNKDVPFTDPDFLFDLSFDPPHAGDAINTPDADMVCSHHQFSAPELLEVPFLGQFHPDKFLTRLILRFFRFFLYQCNHPYISTYNCSIFDAKENKLFP